ncbi:DgyrCDS11764 [Dimorphilus gyrociliatus]|uniref:DgyrCDS11764 n=1 Tax=Dimorphilus gyrociliatus TaxID=2664684 RepID=A0A7I8W4E2_9ANNE|nr:DgyrCDS11764 [Dimorphilus gyrociliatus]
MSKTLKDIPSPKSWPLVGCLPHYYQQGFDKRHLILNEFAREYGSIFVENLAFLKNAIVNDIQEYSKIVKADGQQVDRIPLDPLLHYRRSKGLSDGIVNGIGPKWYESRQLVNKKMLSKSFADAFIEQLHDVAIDFCQKLENDKQDTDLIFDLEFFIDKWAVDSSFIFLFGKRLDCLKGDDIEFVRNLQSVFDILHQLLFSIPLYKIWPTSTWREFERRCDKLFQSALELCQQNQVESETSTSPSLMNYLLLDKNLSKQVAVELTVEMLMGAVEAEIKNADYRNINNITYLKAIVKETLRLYPVTYSTSRILNKDTECGGYELPRGTHVQANLYTMGRNEDRFRNAKEFIPERWLGDEGKNNLVFCNWIFGHGPRLCLGKRLAEEEVYLAIFEVNLSRVI